jgi:hypothetical protein
LRQSRQVRLYRDLPGIGIRHDTLAESEAFRLTEAASVMFSDSHRGKNKQHTLLAMLRQAVYGRLAGYEDFNDAERLRVDPAMRRVVVGRANDRKPRLPVRWAASRPNG